MSPSLTTIYDSLLAELSTFGHEPRLIAIRSTSRALVEAAELGARDPAPSRVAHTHEPRATEVDLDVAITTTGRTLAVKVGVATQAGESDQDTAERAVALSMHATTETIAAYAARGLAFGKIEAGK